MKFGYFGWVCVWQYVYTQPHFRLPFSLHTDGLIYSVETSCLLMLNVVTGICLNLSLLSYIHCSYLWNSLTARVKCLSSSSRTWCLVRKVLFCLLTERSEYFPHRCHQHSWLFFPNSIKEAVTFINAIDANKFSRLISRIIQKLHLKVQTLHSAICDKDKRLLRLLQKSCSARESSACMMTYQCISQTCSNECALMPGPVDHSGFFY